jgi:uncharacterized caspase-like protein
MRRFGLVFVLALAAGRPVTVPSVWAGPVAAKPTLHVIAVGIDAYPQKALRLECAVNDAGGLARAFAEHCAGKDNLYGDVRDRTLLDGQATLAAILAALKDARRAAKPGDLLVFCFAGNGARQGRQFYLLTADADPDKLDKTALSAEDLRAALADVPCQVLLLLDASHAGAAVRAFAADDSPGAAVFCAAMGYEEAQEKDGHGLFTRAVIEALSRADGVPYDHRDGRQYDRNLAAFVQEQVVAASHDTQHPFLMLTYVAEPIAIRQVARQSPGGR